jgi:hypothetical protein
MARLAMLYAIRAIATVFAFRIDDGSWVTKLYVSGPTERL